MWEKLDLRCSLREVSDRRLMKPGKLTLSSDLRPLNHSEACAYQFVSRWLLFEPDGLLSLELPDYEHGQ